MTYDAVLLDFDGVLVELPDRETLYTAVVRACTRVGIDSGVRETARALRSGDVSTLLDRCRDAGVDLDSLCSSAASAVVSAQIREVESGLRSMYDDVTALRALDRPLGIVSDNHPRVLQYLLDRFDMADQFAVVRGCRFTPEELDRRKPNPANLTGAMDELDARDALYVGDREVDVVAADAAGLDSALLARGEDCPADVSPTYRLTSLEELPTRL